MIGILDAGIAGLRLAHTLHTQLPGCDLLYFGDCARGPYGDKGPDVVERFALHGARFLQDQGVALLVIASHCASAMAAERVGAETGLPVVEAIGPAVREALHVTRSFRIGVIGSPAVIASGAHERLVKGLRPEARVTAAACPLLVPLVEAGWMKKPETAMIVRKCVHNVKVRQVDTLILGSAYFYFLAAVIQRKVGRRVRLVDGAAAQAWAVGDYLAARPQLMRPTAGNGMLRFVVSDVSERLVRNARYFFGANITLETMVV